MLLDRGGPTRLGKSRPVENDGGGGPRWAAKCGRGLLCWGDEGGGMCRLLNEGGGGGGSRAAA